MNNQYLLQLNSVLDNYINIIDSNDTTTITEAEKMRRWIIQSQKELTASYGEFVREMNSTQDDKSDLVHHVLSLSSEVGEVCDVIKSEIRQGVKITSKSLLDPDLKHKLMLELGDCLFHIQALTNLCNVTLHEITELNKDKLRERKKTGTLIKKDNRDEH